MKSIGLSELWVLGVRVIVEDVIKISRKGHVYFIGI